MSDEGNEEETSEQEFQKATYDLCIDGGASLHTSHRQLKRWAREVNVVEPAPEARKPLKWSCTPIIFDDEDHPGRTTAVGWSSLSKMMGVQDHLSGLQESSVGSTALTTRAHYLSWR